MRMSIRGGVAPTRHRARADDDTCCLEIYSYIRSLPEEIDTLSSDTLYIEPYERRAVEPYMCV